MQLPLGLQGFRVLVACVKTELIIREEFGRDKMLEYREESRRLDQCQRLYDSSALQKGFELESQRICQVRHC